MRTIHGFIFAFLAVFLATAAQAQTDVNIGGTQIKLVIPDGFCALNHGNPVENSLVANLQEQVKSSNDVLAVFLECESLDKLRKGAGMIANEVVHYQTLTQTKFQSFTAAQIVPTVCAELRANGQELAKKTEGVINKSIDNIKDLAGQVRVNSLQIYGILREDANACYAAMIKKFSAFNQVKTVFTLVAATVVKGKIVYFYRETDFTSEKVVPVVLEQAQATVAALLKNNP